MAAANDRYDYEIGILFG